MKQLAVVLTFVALAACSRGSDNASPFAHGADVKPQSGDTRVGAQQSGATSTAADSTAYGQSTGAAGGIAVEQTTSAVPAAGEAQVNAGGSAQVPSASTPSAQQTQEASPGAASQGAQRTGSGTNAVSGNDGSHP